MKFSEILKNTRISQGLTLRACAAILGVDPSNWSKMERGVTPAPKDVAIVEKWAEAFHLTGSERGQFLDLAALSRNEIPQDMASDARVIEALPVFFRAIRGQELEGDRLAEFMEDLRKLHSPDKN
jgi:transcriptional regulator with XRE-family HTH domain